VSSSEVYGMPSDEDDMPIKETNPIRAANPYSISKVGHDLMSQYFYKAYGLKVIVTRMFSHEGSRRGKEFAISSFANQIAKLERDYLADADYDGNFKIYVGNLESVRTYSHISDAIHAYWLAATKGVIGEVYNIGGSDTCKVGDVLELLMDKSHIPKNRFEIVVDPDRIRPTDITLQIPDCTKFKHETGWEPTKNLEDIVCDLLNYWRACDHLL
jgi:GDP-D-mannose dehydratase